MLNKIIAVKKRSKKYRLGISGLFKMVFAVKISLANPEQKLKPGMPADARILTNSE